jgi:hypothetical protein
MMSGLHDMFLSHFTALISDCFIAYICIDVESYVFRNVVHHITVCVHADLAHQRA